MSPLPPPRHFLELTDWRRRVGDLYRIRGDDALARFRAGRDELFRTHPQSPVAGDARATFAGLEYFPGDPAFRLRAQVEEPEGDAEEEIVIETGGEDGDIRYQRAARLRFTVDGTECALTVFAMTTYGHGLFIPFRDGTSGKETYGGGRYLLDTVKNTDGLALDLVDGYGEVEIDFNYAYNPSCAYDPRWLCPLAPRENWLPAPIRAGEMNFAH